VDIDSEDNAGGGMLDAEDTLEDRGVEDPLDEGYSPPERPRELEGWGLTAREEQLREGWNARLEKEVPELSDVEGDNLGDAEGTDGELLDDEVGDLRAGRLSAENEDEFFASDVGIDGGAASAEEAAVHIVRHPES
jgi:Family of unknown function (DUF5709)